MTVTAQKKTRMETELEAAGENGKAYLKELHAVVHGKDFDDHCKVAAKDKDDRFLATAAKKALAGDAEAKMEVAECIWQTKSAKKNHRR